MTQVFLFRAYYKNANAAAATTATVLQTFGSIARFDEMFGGSMSFGQPPSKPEYLGVWGSRNVSRFRRLIRERLGELAIVYAEPPAQHSLSSVIGRRPTAYERRLMEMNMPTATADLQEHSGQLR